MTKKPAEADYTRCAAEVTPAADGSIYTLAVIYASPSDNFDLLKKAIVSAKATSSVHGIVSHTDVLPPAGGVNRLKVTFSRHNGSSQQTFKTSEMNALTYSLEAQGALNKDGAATFVRKFCEGSGPASMFPPPALPPASTIAAPAVASPAIAPAPASPPAVPLLRYKSMNATIGKNHLTLKNTLKIIYTLSGTSATIRQDYVALDNAIQQAKQALPRQGAVSTNTTIANLSLNPSTSASGVITASFEVEFSRKLGVTTENIQEQEMRDVATALWRQGCLSTTEHPILQTQITNEVAKPGWSRTP